MPTNWLYRRGYVDPSSGNFGLSPKGEIASTTWWVDFSNFFEGVGALGGGDVSLIAGNDVSNVDAVIPTNARMPAGKPSTDNMLQLGGVICWFVPATISMAASIMWNAGTWNASSRQHHPYERDAERQNQWPHDRGSIADNLLPRTGQLLTSARAAMYCLDQSTNPFLLPGGINNNFAYKSYFSTYLPTDEVNVSSLTGNVTVRDAANGGAVAAQLVQQRSSYLWKHHLLR